MGCKYGVIEICPHDTVSFDNNCYWSEDNLYNAETADDTCGDRGGSLASFPSEEYVTFINNAWYVFYHNSIFLVQKAVNHNIQLHCKLILMHNMNLGILYLEDIVVKHGSA